MDYLTFIKTVETLITEEGLFKDVVFVYSLDEKVFNETREMFNNKFKLEINKKITEFEVMFEGLLFQFKIKEDE